MKKYIVLLIAVFPVLAVTGIGGFGLALGLPQNEFKDNIDRAGFGVSFDFGAKLNPYFAIGGAFAMQSYGTEKRTEPFSTTIPDVFVEVTTNNNFLFFQIAPRIYAPIPYVTPYIEGRVGLNYLWTDTKIEDIGDNEEVASSTNIDDVTHCYGGGGGLLINVWNKSKKNAKRKAEDSPEAVFIDIKVIYAMGGNAEYLKEGSIYRGTTGTVQYDISESRTDLLTISAGVAVEF
ncbi:hypothetical protein KAH81_01985 [bacterium]|nr:hypothetical protein [bacterium]